MHIAKNSRMSGTTRVAKELAPTASFRLSALAGGCLKGRAASPSGLGTVTPLVVTVPTDTKWWQNKKVSFLS